MPTYIKYYCSHKKGCIGNFVELHKKKEKKKDLGKKNQKKLTNIASVVQVKDERNEPEAYLLMVSLGKNIVHKCLDFGFAM